jgi:hypothetical protein
MTKLAANSISCAVVIATLFMAAPARADALPPAEEDCIGPDHIGGTVALGGACSLHDSANTPGTCQNSTCGHATNPSLCDADGKGSNCGGGTQVACVLCIAGTAGDGGSATDGGTTSKQSTGGGGCSVVGSDASLLNVLLPLGLATLVPLALRRRNRKSNGRSE